MARDVEFNYTASDKTGPASQSVVRTMRKTGEQVKKDQDKLNSDFAKSVVKLAEGVSPKLAASLTQSFAGAADAGGPLLIAGVAAAAPLIGATISAAVIGGVGIGGVIGGVLLAAKDPAVQAAGKTLGDNLTKSLQADAQPFVKPLLAGIDEVQAKFDQIQPRLQRIFANSSKFLDPLLGGVLRFVDATSAGVDSLIANAGPVMDELGDDIGRLGEAAGHFLSTVGGGSKGAALALQNLTSGIVGIINVTGPVIRGLTEVYYWVDKLHVLDVLNPAALLVHGFQDMKAAFDDGTFTGQLQKATAGISSVGVQAAAAAGPIENFTEKVDRLASAGRGLYDSTTNVGKAVDTFKQSLKDNGKTLDANTEKGRANRDALSGLASSLVANYDAYVKVNGEGRNADKVAAANRQSFITLAEKLKLSSSQANTLANQLGLIPAKKQTDYYANTHDAAARVKALQDQINGTKGKTVTLTVVTVHKSKGGQTLYGNQGAQDYDARNSFTFANGDPGGRTDPARPVEVTSTVENSLYLDGRLIYGTTARQIRASSKRDAWRQKVGRR